MSLKIAKKYTPVIIESPLSGDFRRNMRYARLSMYDCLVNHDEAPYASHLIYPQCLDDRLQVHRDIGMQAGFAVAELFKYRKVYNDLGISRGMEFGIAKGKELGQDIEYRQLPEELMKLLDNPSEFAKLQSPGWHA